MVDAYDDACKASEEADEMFADVYDRAQVELEVLKKEAAIALHKEEVKVRADRLLLALQASLEPAAEETTEKVG